MYTFLAIFDLSLIVVLCGFSRTPPSPSKKNTWHLKKKWVFTGRLFTSQKNVVYNYYFLYLIKERRYSVNQSVWIADGKEKVMANEEKGRRGPEKGVHLKTSSLTCRVSPRFQPKNSQKRQRGFLLDPPPSPFVVLRGFTRNRPSPLNGPRGLYTAPYFAAAPELFF